MFIRPGTFRRRMNLLRALGYRVVSLDEGLDAARRSLGEDLVVITIDDGWWSTGAFVWPTLQSMSYPATLYVDTANLLAQEPIVHVMAAYFGTLVRRGQLRLKNGRTLPVPEVLEGVEPLIEEAKQMDLPTTHGLRLLQTWADATGVDLHHYNARRVFEYVSPETLRAMSKSGLDVQLHTHGHSLGDFGRSVVENEIETNRQNLSEICEVAPERLSHFCYPSGETSEGIASLLKSIGVQSATLTSGGLIGAEHNPYLLPRILDGDQMSDLEFEAALCGVTLARG